MNETVKPENDVSDVPWNWKLDDARSFPKTNTRSTTQNYYLFEYNLPSMLLNPNNSNQNIAFNGNFNSPENETDFAADISKLKTTQLKIENSDDSNDVEDSNHFNDNGVEYNPRMLLQIELNAPQPSFKQTSSGTAPDNNNTNMQINEGMKQKVSAEMNFDLNNLITEEATTPKLLKCSICDKDFLDENVLEVHINAHKQRSKSRRCDYCEQTFPSKGKWYAHFKTHFNDPSFDCAFCNTSFVTEKYLEEHLKSHNNKSPLLIDNVNFSVDHSEDRYYPCTFCGREFPDRSSILFHLRIHTSEIVYRCMHCGKMFLNKSELNLHVRIHTGDKAHICELCNKSFLTTSNLKQHLRIHTGDKPFCCTNCDKTFSNKSNLMQHMKVHTGEKPYRCKFCEKSFTTTSNLTQHLRTHTGIKPYVCDLCGKAFINNSNLSQHKKVHRAVGTKKDETEKMPHFVG